MDQGGNEAGDVGTGHLSEDDDSVLSDPPEADDGVSQDMEAELGLIFRRKLPHQSKRLRSGTLRGQRVDYSFNGVGQEHREAYLEALEDFGQRRRSRPYVTEKDDDEPLPRPRRSVIEAIKFAGPAAFLQPSPAYSRAESAPDSPNSDLASRLHRNGAEIRTSDTTHAGSVPNIAAINSNTAILSPPPANSRQSTRPKKRSLIDLTQDEGADATRIKQEVFDPIYVRTEQPTTTTTPAVIDDDEEDMRDELRAIELKRKLRAIDKKKRAAGLMGS